MVRASHQQRERMTATLDEMCNKPFQIDVYANESMWIFSTQNVSNWLLLLTIRLKSIKSYRDPELFVIYAYDSFGLRANLSHIFDVFIYSINETSPTQLWLIFRHFVKFSRCSLPVEWQITDAGQHTAWQLSKFNLTSYTNTHNTRALARSFTSCRTDRIKSDKIQFHIRSAERKMCCHDAVCDHAGDLYLNNKLQKGHFIAKAHTSLPLILCTFWQTIFHSRSFLIWNTEKGRNKSEKNKQKISFKLDKNCKINGTLENLNKMRTRFVLISCKQQQKL